MGGPCPVQACEASLGLAGPDSGLEPEEGLSFSFPITFLLLSFRFPTTFLPRRLRVASVAFWRYLEVVSRVASVASRSCWLCVAQGDTQSLNTTIGYLQVGTPAVWGRRALAFFLTEEFKRLLLSEYLGLFCAPDVPQIGFVYMYTNIMNNNNISCLCWALESREIWRIKFQPSWLKIGA